MSMTAPATQSCKLYAIPARLLDHYWDYVVEKLNNVLDYTGDKDINAIYRDISENRKQLWIINDQAILITETLNNGDCLLYMVSGEGLDEWANVIYQIEDWARSVGCKKMLAVGRKGWERVGKPYGYGLAYCTFKKDL